MLCVVFRVCPKQNVPTYTRAISNFQDGAFVKNLIQYHEYTLESEYARVLNLVGISKIMSMSEYAPE